MELAAEAIDGRFSEASDILLLSDGDDPAGDDEWRQGIAAAKEKGVPVHVVGVGDPAEASTIPAGKGVLRGVDGREVWTRLEEEPLKQIARDTKGSYLPAHTSRVALGKMYLDTIQGQGVRGASVDPLPLYRQRYPWFLLPALALFALAVALPDRLPRVRLPLRRRPRKPASASVQVSMP